MAGLFNKKRKGKAVAESSSEAPRFKSPFHEAHFKGKLSARKVLPELAIDYNDEILSPCAMQIKMRKWEKLTAPLPAVGHNLEPDKAKRKPYTYTTMVQGKDISFAPSNIKRVLRLRKDPLPNALLMKRERLTKIIGLKRCWNASALKEESGRLDQQQEENRKSFEAINTRMDRMDDQLNFLCYSNQMANETMYYPYRNTARQFREMEAQGVPVTISNLAIHRHREEEMNRERMRHNQTVQEATSQRAREEESEEMYTSPSEEW
ncbi:hypothetical protein PIB30_092476 [Stylosanthes scabra]|uniref:Uncharacterized protein n=1 Tax=Stylosanthes scabra TaxID=79078 RepID=A0ABU6XSI5_9FABA|nr:hypothetical protein [Stylosanthes scabra]